MTTNNISEPSDICLIPYNTGMQPLPLPEYGRMIQNLVDFCIDIEDREQRTECAHAIIRIMARLFPQMKCEAGERKLWDHLNIMARFELDIDFPFDVITAESIQARPKRLPYADGALRHKHYGRNVRRMVKTVADMEEGPERDKLIIMVANHMKKLMMITNAEGATDSRIFNDLYEFSDHRISLSEETTRLHEFLELTPAVNKKYKKRKK